MAALIPSAISFLLLLRCSLVGVTGFEPATSWSRTKRTTKLCHTPNIGANDGIRTHDLQFTKLLLCRLSYIGKTTASTIIQAIAADVQPTFIFF